MTAYKRSQICLLFLSAATVARDGHGQTTTSSPAGLRREVHAALASPFPGSAEKHRDQAERFLSLYAAAKELPAAERARLRLRLKSRLARLASGIRQDVDEKRRAGLVPPAPVSASSTASETAPKTGRAGGGPQDEDQALVDLIEATIAPETWDVNGGPGTIKYWPAWHALVVRQTDEVHEQLGGVVRDMRK